MFPIEATTLSLFVKFMVLIAVVFSLRMALSYRHFMGRTALLFVPMALCLGLLLVVHRIQSAEGLVPQLIWSGAWVNSVFLFATLMALFLCYSTLVVFWVEVLTRSTGHRWLPLVQRAFWATVREWLNLFALSLLLGLVLYWGGLVVLSTVQLLNTVFLIFISLVTYSSLRKLLRHAIPKRSSHSPNT